MFNFSILKLTFNLLHNYIDFSICCVEKIDRFCIENSKDISLPSQLQRAMATETESYRLANAKIIVARAEIESTKNLQKATTLHMDNPYYMQLRYLQALQMIAGDKTHTIVMPFSAESLKKLFK